MGLPGLLAPSVLAAAERGKMSAAAGKTADRQIFVVEGSVTLNTGDILKCKWKASTSTDGTTVWDSC